MSPTTETKNLPQKPPIPQAEVLGGPLIGKTLDRFGRGVSVLLLLSIQVAGFYAAHLGNQSQDKMMIWIAAGLLGMGDSGWVRGGGHGY